MTPEMLAFIKQCIEDDNIHAFYVSGIWIKRRPEILAYDKHECQYCKARGKYKKATIVHHIKHLKDHPELALDLFYIDENGNRLRQLISVCFQCHEEKHPERRKVVSEIEMLAPERW